MSWLAWLITLNPLDLLALAPGLALALWARSRLRHALAIATVIPSSLTGAEWAATLLRIAGLDDVEVREAGGPLTNLFDLLRRSLRLAPWVFSGRSIATLAIAAQEAEHAIQFPTRSWRARLRRVLILTARLGAIAAWLLAIAGMLYQWEELLVAGFLCFSATVCLELVTLPIERTAARAAQAHLEVDPSLSPAQNAAAVGLLNAITLRWVAAPLFDPLVGRARSRPRRVSTADR